MSRYERDDKLEVHNTPYVTGIKSLDGEIVTVLAGPGHSLEFPLAYGVLFGDGVLRAVHPRFLRKLPLVAPVDRGDTDITSNWEAFDKATKLDSFKFRYMVL